MAVIKIVPMPGAEGQRGEQGETGPQGPQGDTGATGPAGADAVWYYNGEYNPGASYVVGDVVTYDGQLWYRKHANGGNVGDTPSEGFIWDLLAAKGADGEPGTAGQDSLLPTSGTWNPRFAELSGITYSNSEQYEMGKYYCIGDLVFFDLTVHLGYVSDWGNPAAPTYNNFKFELPFEMPGSGLGVAEQSGPATRIPFLGQILENYTDPSNSSTWSQFPVFGQSISDSKEINVYSTTGAGMNQSLQPVTSLWPSNFTESQGGSNSSFSMSGVYRKE
jgi:hypothetical protein